jgi:hypothetical protein
MHNQTEDKNKISANLFGTTVKNITGKTQKETKITEDRKSVV